MADVTGNTQQIHGTRSIDEAAGDKPVVVAGRASAATPTAVSADGDVQAVWLDTNGRVVLGDQVVFADVNATQSPAITKVPRVAADIMVQDPSGNLTNRVRAANSTTGGVGGGALIAAGACGYDATNFRPVAIDTSGRQIAVGAVAHDAAIAGNPVRVGARAVNAEVTAVANGDAADLVTDLTGKQIVLPYANPENFVAGFTSDITGTTDTSVIAAQGVGVRIYVTQLVVQNSHATVSTWVNIKDNTTTIYTVYAPAVGGGVSVTLPVPLRLTANVALQAACVTTGANVRVSASGYKGV